MTQPRQWFTAFGVEIEYIIVDAETFAVRPIADRLIQRAAGSIVSEVDFGELSWSNELALHVIEFKTTYPAASLAGLSQKFDEHVGRADSLLAEFGARLMPAAMHPFMDPDREMQLWPHESNEIYEAFHRIFDCRGHGWANLQSSHLNLPFADDEQFGRLHAAIRLLLPLLPGLSAASPLAGGGRTGFLDTRLEVYRNNAARIPSVSGNVVPEPIFSREEYEAEVLQRMYRDIASQDPEGILQHEWLNARGAIARWDRHTIEIRVLDTQECPSADLAVLQTIAAVLRRLADESVSSYRVQQQASQRELVELLHATIRDADAAAFTQPTVAKALGLSDLLGGSVGEAWKALVDRTGVFDSIEPAARPLLDTILREGPVARRIETGLPENPQRDDLLQFCRQLCESLRSGSQFGAVRRAEVHGG